MHKEVARMRPTLAITLPIKCRVQELLPKLEMGHRAILRQMAEHGIYNAGAPFVIHHDHRRKLGVIHVEAGIVVNRLPVCSMDPEFETQDFTRRRVAVVTHWGPRELIHRTYDALEEYMAAKEVKATGSPWESFVTHQAATPKTTAWVTKIYQGLE